MGIIWDKHQQISFPSNDVLFISDNHAIKAVVHLILSLSTSNHDRTELLHIMVRWDTPATSSHTQQDSSGVYGICCLLHIQFWHQADYIVLRTSHFISLSSSSPIPHQQVIDAQPPPPGESRAEWSWLAGAASNASLIGTQQECGHQIVHRGAGNAATKHMTQDSHFKIVRMTGSSKNKKQHAVDVSISISR